MSPHLGNVMSPHLGNVLSPHLGNGRADFLFLWINLLIVWRIWRYREPGFPLLYRETPPLPLSRTFLNPKIARQTPTQSTFTFPHRRSVIVIRVPSYFVDQELEVGTLEPIFENQSMSENQIQMIYPQLLEQSKRLQTFIKFTIEYFSDLKL